MKRNKLRIALLQTLFVLTLAVCGLVYFAYWIAESNDSDFARKARDFTGIPKVTGDKNKPTPGTPDDLPDGLDPFDMPADPTTGSKPVFDTIREISFAEVAARKSLWPEALTLKLNIDLSIRFNGQNFGFMRFTRGRPVTVVSLMPNGEIVCETDGNYINLSVYETDFYGWFREAYGEVYALKPVTVDFETLRESKYGIDTKEGQSAFWAEMREWCYNNYDSPSLSLGEDGLIFNWVPREKVPIDFNSEAREIARQYLLRRAKYGSHENFATCEIRNPTTGETLGAASLFIPRL